MKLFIEAHSLPKRGCSPGEYEDAWAIEDTATRLAIADGATDSFESRLWADALVRAFIVSPPEFSAESVLAWLSEPISAWRSGIKWEQLKYYQEEKARRGSFATFLGLILEPPESHPSTNDGQATARWQALAIGDACLFILREGVVKDYFPIENSDQFGSTPDLLSTVERYSRRSLENLRLLSGEGSVGDLFILATDALSEWLMREIERGESPLAQMDGLSDDEFGAFIEKQRDGGAMRNDDVTFVRATIVKDVSISESGFVLTGRPDEACVQPGDV